MRCGWRARRAWDENVRVDRSSLALDPAEAFDPAMAVLDEELGSAPKLKSRRKGKGGSEKPTAKTPDEPRSDEFELPPLTELDAAELPDRQTSERDRVRKSGRRKVDRMRRGRRREIIGAVAIAAGVMFIVVMLGLTGSCRGVI
jgi:hypothetical protein